MGFPRWRDLALPWWRSFAHASKRKMPQISSMLGAHSWVGELRCRLGLWSPAGGAVPPAFFHPKPQHFPGWLLDRGICTMWELAKMPEPSLPHHPGTGRATCGLQVPRNPEALMAVLAAPGLELMSVSCVLLAGRRLSTQHSVSCVCASPLSAAWQGRVPCFSKTGTALGTWLVTGPSVATTLASVEVWPVIRGGPEAEFSLSGHG